MKVRSGEKIEIRVERDVEIGNPQIADSRSGEESAGIFPIEKQPDYLPRRVSEELGIIFYDFGQIFDEATQTFRDINFRLDRFYPNDPTTATADSIGASDLLALKDYLFSVPTGDWKTKYRKLDFETGERYGVDLTTGDIEENRIRYPVARTGSRTDIFGAEIVDTRWTEKGLVLNDANISNFQISSFAGFMDFFVGEFYGIRLFKVTNAPDYSAPDVSDFKLSKNASFFLMPTLFAHFSTHDLDTGGGNALRKTLVNDYQILSREFWLNRNLPEFRAGAFSGFGDTVFDLTDDNASDWTARIKAQANASVIELDTGSGIFTTTNGGSSFPDDAFQSLIANYLTSNQIVNFTPSYVSPGVFVGAIQQNGQTFYVWSEFTYNLTDSLISVYSTGGEPHSKYLAFNVL